MNNPKSASLQRGASAEEGHHLVDVASRTCQSKATLLLTAIFSSMGNGYEDLSLSLYRFYL